MLIISISLNDSMHFNIGELKMLNRGDEWTEVTSGQRWSVDRGDEWTEVVSGQR